MTTLTELYSNSEKAFLSTLQVQVKQQLLEKVEAPPADLSPSPGIPLLLALLRDIVSIASVAEGRQDDITKVGEHSKPCNKSGLSFLAFIEFPIGKLNWSWPYLHK